MNAETAYLFRHALLRDAAYQLPGERARLHALAVEAIEGLAGGRAPVPEALEVFRAAGDRRLEGAALLRQTGAACELKEKSKAMREACAAAGVKALDIG